VRVENRPRGSKPSAGSAEVRARLPAFARAFGGSDHDEVRFTNLKPLAAGSPWSAVAVISPFAEAASGGIVGQRHAGSNAFTLALRDGAIAAESGALTRVSQLIPQMNAWSRIGVTCATDGTHFYLGADGDVRSEDGLGLPANTCGTEAPVVIGRAGATFAGAIAVVCLFAEKLPDATMQAIVRGTIDPCFAPKLVFAWLAAGAGAGDIEIVSRRVAVVRGTRVVPVAAPATKIPAAVFRPAPTPIPVPTPTAPAEHVAAPSRSSHSTLFHELGLDDD